MWVPDGHARQLAIARMALALLVVDTFVVYRRLHAPSPDADAFLFSDAEQPFASSWAHHAGASDRCARMCLFLLAAPACFCLQCCRCLGCLQHEMTALRRRAQRRGSALRVDAARAELRHARGGAAAARRGPL